MLHTRDPVTGHAVTPDGFVLDRRPTIPPAGRFLHRNGYETPTTIRGYDWSSDFGRWGAYVTFADGWSGFTFPEIVRPHAFDYADGNLAWLGCPVLDDTRSIVAINLIVADPHPDDATAVAVQTAPGVIRAIPRCRALWYVARIPPGAAPGQRWPEDE